MKSDKGIRWGQCKNPLFARLLEDFIKRLQPLMSGYEIVWFKSALTELKEKDACCPKDKKMEVEENKK